MYILVSDRLKVIYEDITSFFLNLNRHLNRRLIRSKIFFAIF